MTQACRTSVSTHGPQVIKYIYIYRDKKIYMYFTYPPPKSARHSFNGERRPEFGRVAVLYQHRPQLVP